MTMLQLVTNGKPVRISRCTICKKKQREDLISCEVCGKSICKGCNTGGGSPVWCEECVNVAIDLAKVEVNPPKQPA